MHKPQYTEFYKLRIEAGFRTRESTAELCGVTTRTIATWDQQKAPEVAVRLMRILARDLGGFDENWRGWKFHAGELYGPGRLRLSPEEIRQIPQQSALITALQTETRNYRNHWTGRLKRAVDTLKRKKGY